MIPVPPGKQRVLLAALLLRAGRPAGVDELAEALWGSDPPPSARVSLQNYVARLRKVLGGAGPAILTEPGGYLIRVGSGELDVGRFEAAVASGRAAAATGAWADASAVLAKGLALWRGEPLAGVASEALAAREVPRLAELRLQALEIRVDADLHLGRHADVIAELRRLVTAEPLRERLHGLLMLALYRDGQQAAALAAYQAARDVLIAELGAEPGPELQRLQAQVLVGDPALAGEPGTASRDLAAAELDGPEPGQPGPEVRYSLPPDTAAFTGREGELSRITAITGAMASAARAGGVGPGGAGPGGVVAIGAIDGMPGIGKTALAIHAAHLLRDKFPDRQLFIDLRGHTPGQEPIAPEAALAGLLAATGVDLRHLPGDLAGRAGLWRDKMAGQRALLVLDNAASSAQVTPLLPGGDGCLVLVTSRRHLADLPGTIVPVLLETLPPRQAREMFARLAPRAAGAPPAQLAELVSLAGLLPLAISLLARVFNRHPSWSLADLAAETRASLLTMAAENDSIAAAFEVSWQHLAACQREFFRLLGLHPGTTIDAYAAAALVGLPLGDAAALLDGLHGEGLLTETGYRRYGMHDLIRRYAADRAAADPVPGWELAVGRLLDYYQHTASRAEALLSRQPAPAGGPAVPAAVPDLPDGARALAWARAERNTLLACLRYASRVGDDARVVALTAAVAALLRHDGPWTEAVTLHAAAVRAARQLGDRRGQADALRNLGIVRRMAGDLPAAAESLGEALCIYRDLGDRLGQASALYYLGDTGRMAGDLPAAVQSLGEALSTCRELGDRVGQASALHYLGAVRLATGDYRGVADALEEALDISRDLGDQPGAAGALILLGAMRRITGDIPGAERVLARALEISRQFGNRVSQATALTRFGEVRRATGDYAGAARDLWEALDISRDLDDQLGQASALLGLGAVRRAAGDFAGAARFLGEALGLYRDIGDRAGEVEALNEVGLLHRDRGDIGLARDCHRQALELAREIGVPWGEGRALDGLARCALAADDTAGAAACLRGAWEIFERIGVPEATGIAAELDALSRPEATSR